MECETENSTNAAHVCVTILAIGYKTIGFDKIELVAVALCDPHWIFDHPKLSILDYGQSAHRKLGNDPKLLVARDTMIYIIIFYDIHLMFKVHLISMYLGITYLIVSPKWPIKISPSVLVKVLEAFPWPLALVVSSKQFNLKSSHRTGPRMIIAESFPPTKTSTGPQILRQTPPPPICFNRCWLADFPDDLAGSDGQSIGPQPRTPKRSYLASIMERFGK